jgi:purine-nucleoside phosphorylase
MEAAADRVAHSARELARRLGVERHDVLVLLGSGLSGAAELLGAGQESVSLDTVPFFPPYTAGGHRAHAWSVQHNGLRILVLGGRCHLYEGLTPVEVVHPLRTGIAAGCRTVILTAAAGGIRDDLPTGAVMVVEDHLNLTGRSPLIGPEFVDMVDAYAPRLRSLALTSPEPAASVLAARAGVYAQLPGPQFETPAEIRMLRALGADLVGMSTALEAIAARHLGAEVLAISLVSNLAAGITGQRLDHAEVVAAGKAAAARMGGLLAAILPRVLPGAAR